MRSTLGILLVAVMTLPTLAATTQPTNTAGTESLGNKLLDDLKPTTPPPNNENSQSPHSPLPTPHSPLVAPSSAPLARVQQGMQNAQSLLAQPGAATKPGAIKLAGTVQQEVVTELDKLIAELSKQCQSQCQGQCDKPGDRKPGGKPKPGKPGAAGRGTSAARESSDRLDRTTAKPVNKGDVTDVVKELWGHLPERAREQMLQSFSDDFLPKYEFEIEQYYRKLSEEQSQSADAQRSGN